ncbi:ABC transporter permease [Mucilaginibacter sp. BJC16-A38]|uniref:ABC transporter permease n=1 Tax=Mucilaginibacter phenanthrenivorans TaxID=1234842 RepID=UPI002156F9B5|nr:FtsX-like permease family protein [Mucilaginibacter phenanthrenivorans]MCR8559228.1 ABC transporter permease [Mucilaginibacter phenanthrenivorans]
MIRNYIKIAWRNLLKHRGFSLINILGLSVGIVFTLLIGAYVWDELQVNRNLKNAGDQYIILSKWKNPNMGLEVTSVAQLSQALKDEYPGLVVNCYNSTPAFTNVSNGNNHFREGLQIGDSTLLSMYGFKLLHGDPRTAFREPSTVVVTCQAAKKYFGKTDVIGLSLSFEDFKGHKKDFMITGVLDELPENTVTKVEYHDVDFFFNVFASNYFNRHINGWNNRSVVDYIQLKKGADPARVEAVMRDLLKQNSSAEIYNNLTPYLMPLKSYHLQANNGLVNKMLWTLSCIAFFVLSMAIINFVNIYIGRSASRMKEIGVRKVMGGMRKQLVYQFLTESVFMVVLATAVSLIIYLWVSPYFGDLIGKKITALFSFPVYFIIIPVLFSLLIGLIAGIYPALILSAYKSIDSLKANSKGVARNVFSRKVLVAFQFTTAAVVFISVIIISQQINLFFNSNLGYNKDFVIYAQVPRDWSAKGVEKMEAIGRQFERMPQIGNTSLSWEIPANIDWENEGPVYRQGDSPMGSVASKHLTDDNQFAATYGIYVRAGSFFKPIVTENDSSQAVINETEAKALGWKNPENAVGQKIVFMEDVFTITGVVADFHFGSMQERIQPLVFTNVNYSNSYRYLSFKLKGGDLTKSIGALQAKWNELMPGEPFAWSFMDDALKKVYAGEIRLKQAATVAAVLAFVIVLLGILGLVSLSIQKRTKEIGIRKVLGSPVATIISLFLKEFLSIVTVACLVACPLAYMIMDRWLNGYAYRVSISILPFITSTVVIIFITTILIIVQTAKAANVSPIKSLKSE